MPYLQPSIDSLYPNTAGIKIGLPNSSNKGFDIKAGIPLGLDGISITLDY